MNKTKSIIFYMTAVIFPVLFLSGAEYIRADEGIGVVINTPDNPWTDVNLNDRLNLYFSSINSIPIHIIESEAYGQTSTNKIRNLNEILAVGRKQKFDYVIDIHFDFMDLEKRKVTVIPQVLFRYRVFAVLKGNLRIFDVQNERLISLKEIDYEVKAKDRWQFFDDDRHDADLKIPPHKKVLLFKQLEDKAASELSLIIRQFIGEEIDD